MAGGAAHGTRALVVGLLVSVLLAGAAGTAAVVTGSVALVAVAAQAGAVAVGQGLMLAAGRRARRQAGGLLPFGFGRERYFWPMVVSAVLLLAGAGVAGGVGVPQIDGPEALTRPEWAYAVLGVGLVLTAVALRLALTAFDGARGRASRRRYLRSARSPEVPVALVDHVSAIVGLALALAGVAAAEVAGDARWDGVGAIAVGVVAVVTAVVVVAEVRSLLIGASASRKDVESIVAAIEIDPSVQRLIHMRAQQMGPEELLVGAKVELDHTLTFPEVSEVVNRIERNVRSAIPMARVMYLEPDVTAARRAAPTIDEHVPDHAVPEEVRARLDAEARRGAIGVGIPLEGDHRR